MTLLENILLFLPLALGICLVASVLQQETIQSAFKNGLKFFAKLIVAVLVISILLTLTMEWVLGTA